MVTKTYNISDSVIVYITDTGLLYIVDTVNDEHVVLDYDEQQNLNNLFNGGLYYES